MNHSTSLLNISYESSFAWADLMAGDDVCRQYALELTGDACIRVLLMVLVVPCLHFRHADWRVSNLRQTLDY